MSYKHDAPPAYQGGPQAPPAAYQQQPYGGNPNYPGYAPGPQMGYHQQQGGYYPPQQGGYYPPQQGGYYPQQGGYYDHRRDDGGSSGCLAGICGALACCCCLDLLF